MNINFDSIWHIVGLLGTVGSLIFYAAQTLGKTMEQIERLQDEKAREREEKEKKESRSDRRYVGHL